ncbi:alkaline phosphatase family protein [Bryobacter aggregatus]|uniref:alkaline phosphatase family protein n=1 Tax=Bryobacter aggregatus TaxID=360054 RepID=UPI0004E10D2D|nr:ectonucleotide pyrophosphatase/phosphodiesterase [Bryobacter aggregatus]
MRLIPLLFLAISALVAADRKVVLISIDGLRGTTLAKLPSLNVKAPNLKEFVKNGALADGLVGVFPTVTYPSHTTMMTGRSPLAHGILGNTLFDPEKKMNGAWYWYSESIQVPTLWDVARQKGLKTAAVAWPVTVGAQIDANLPEYRTPRTIDDRFLFNAISTPGLVSKFEKSEGALPVADQTDADRTRMATYLIRTQKPDLLLVHLIDLDHEEHLYGPDTPETFKTLEQIDECLGKIRAEVRQAGLEKDTTFVIVSDHGFFPVQKAFQPNAVLHSLGLQNGDKWRIAAHTNGGSFALMARDPADKEAITLATKVFQALSDQGLWGIERVLSRSDLNAMKAYPGAFLAVSMANGFTLGGAITGPWVLPSGNTRGMHGYAPGPLELDASFVAFGAGVTTQNLGRAKLLDVAPTIAKILQLTLPDLEGKNLLP